MKSYILALVVLCSLSLAAPAMAATLNATQISDTEMLVNGTGFTPDAEVTLSTSTIIPVTSPGSAYSYEMTGIYLPAGSVLTLDASPVKGDLNLHVKIKKYLTLVKTYKYPADSTGTVHVERSIPSLPGVDGVLFQTIRVYGTATNSSVVVNLSVTVQRDVNTDESGSFSEKVNINGIPAGKYTITATDGTNTATTDITIYGSLYSIVITKPDTRELTLNTTEYYLFEAKGYDLKKFVVGHLTFGWTSVSTYVGTINSTGYFEAKEVGHTKVYARGGTKKKSKHVTVYVNAPVDNETLSDDTNFTLESGNANVTGNFSVVVSGDVAVQAVGNVTASVSDATTVGLGAGYEFISGAIVNVSEKIHTALEGGNGTVTIKLCVSEPILEDMGLARSNVQIYVYNDSAGKWVGLTTTRVGATDCYTADISDYLSEATVGIGSKPAPTPSGGGGDSTYPPGWFETPTPAPTATPQPGVTPAPAGVGVTPAPAKPAEAGVTTASAGEEPTKKDIPGFTAVFAIAGLLAIAYVVMRRHR